VTGSIRVEGLGKKFRLFHERPRSLKEVITLRRRRTFDEFWALKDVSFSVATGETIGIIGANGSGKSTLLKCLARIFAPDEGSIAVEGRMGALLELGAGFHPELTGRENVFLNGSILGVSRRELRARFDEIVALAGLERFIDTPVKNYSSGMYIRLGFAVAVSIRPDVLLVDEVLAVGDAEFQRKSSAKFREMRATGRTIVLVTHGLQTVREMCDQAILLRDGRVAEIGDASSVVDSYLRALGETPVPPDLSSTRAGHRTRELEIAQVEFCGADGRPGSPVVAGRAMQVRFEWVAHVAVSDPVFQIDLFESGGVQIAEANSVSGGLRLSRLEGKGLVEFTVPDLLLGPGEYLVSVAIRDVGGTRTYDCHNHAHILRVEPGPGMAQRGFLRLPGRWASQSSAADEP
jgi:ABC-2 type transport system ATP-binding protein